VDDHFSVNASGARVDVPDVGSDLAEAVGPILTAAGEYFDDRVFQMDLDAITVELDFMDPPLTVWHGVDRGRQRRLHEPGERHFDAGW
jgi:hypothetical protein